MSTDAVVEHVDERTGEVVPYRPPTNPLDVPTEMFQAALLRRKDNRNALMQWVKSALVKGTDYGSITIAGRESKPSLWKPGAEKICGMLGVTQHYPTLRDYEQAAIDGKEIKTIIIQCELIDSSGRTVGHGAGARSLAQDKGDVNKCLKMAKKSALIDATLGMAGLSEVFTQDIEDMKPEAGQQPLHPSDPANPTASHQNCPKCGGPMWDNRDKNLKRIELNKTLPADQQKKPQPAWNCKNKACGGLYWTEDDLPGGLYWTEDDLPKPPKPPKPDLPEGKGVNGSLPDQWVQIQNGFVALNVPIDKQEETLTKYKVSQPQDLTREQADHLIALLEKKLAAREEEARDGPF